jgi:hypothetical protein
LKDLSVNPKFVLTGDNSPDVYMTILADVDDDVLEAAVMQYLSEANQFTPIATPGVLREKAMDLQMLALGVPTGGEAWGMVLAAVKSSGPQWCEVGGSLRDEALITGRTAVYYAHMKACGICNDQPTSGENYSHPVVRETVRLLGGRDAVVTDNPVSDRSRFIDAYKELVLRERTKAGMTKQVRAFVSERMYMFDNIDPVYRIRGGVDDVVEHFTGGDRGTE